MSHAGGRFGCISDNRYCWAPKGMRPKAPRQIVRKFLDVHAAVCTALVLMLVNQRQTLLNLICIEITNFHKLTNTKG
jgi:hypothetical protein